MSRARRTRTLGCVATEVHAFTFVTPTPLVLTWGRGPVIHHHVIATTSAIVGTTSSALALGCVAVKEETLTFVTPTPVLLTRSEIGDDPVQLGPIGLGVGTHAEVGERAPE